MKRLMIALGCIFVGVIVGIIARGLEQMGIISAATVLAGVTTVALYSSFEPRTA